MLFLFCQCEVSVEIKEKLRAMVKERTGEDCLILGPPFTDIRSFQVKRDRTVPFRKRLSRIFKK